MVRAVNSALMECSVVATVLVVMLPWFAETAVLRQTLGLVAVLVVWLLANLTPLVMPALAIMA